jgi:ectoine hydroxylase-related dioxygenase (phytanoyl-CoA dioxygenase family)
MSYADQVKLTGFDVIPSFLPNHAKLRAECMELYAADSFVGKVIDTDGSHRVKGLLRSPEVVSLLEHSSVLQTVREVIGGPIILGGASLNIVKPGSKGMGFHRDYPYLSVPASFNDDEMQPLVVQIIVALDDFTPFNGPTRIVPCSQGLSVLPPDPTDHSNIRLLKTGDALIAHGGMWHKVEPNTTENDRVTLLLNFHPYWVRPLNTVTGIAGPGILLEHLTPTIQSLLGFNFGDMFLRDLEKVGYGVMKPKGKK